MWWTVAVVAAGTTVVLSVMVAIGDLDTADRLASVVGAVAGVVALAVSVYAIFREPAPDVAPVRAQDGSNAAAGSMRTV